MADILDEYTKDQLLQILGNDIGLRFEIPDILTFLDDDYYLGNIFYNKRRGKSRIYPIWRDRLQEVFPNPLTTKSSYITVSGCIGCLTGDTEIETLNGAKTFKELKEQWDSKREPIYIMAANPDKQVIEADEVIDVFISGIKQVYEVTLDNGCSFRCTSNHQFLSKDNKWISIDSGMNIGDSLMPFNHSTKRGYYTYIDPYSNQEKYRYAEIGKQFLGEKPAKYQTHHIDFNKLNDVPTNIVYLPTESHFNIHRGQKTEPYFSEADYCKWYAQKNRERVYNFHHNEKYIEQRALRNNKLSQNMKQGQALTMLEQRRRIWLEHPEHREKISKQAIEFNKNYHPRLRKDITKESLHQAVMQTGSYRPEILASYLHCSKSKINQTINMPIREFCKELGFFYRGRYGNSKHIPTIEEIIGLYKRYGNDRPAFFAEAFHCTVEEIESVLLSHKEQWEQRNFNHKIIKIEKLGHEEVYDLTTKSHHNFALKCGIFAHNSGKSTFSQIIFMYDYIKLLSMEDPGEFFELINQTGIWMFGASFFKYKAEEFMGPIKAMLSNCPFIQDLKKQGEFNDNIKLASAYGKQSIVSTDAAFIWLSEVNEYRKPDDIISSSLSRMRGRFQKGLGLFNHFILDCSDTTVDSATERFIHNSPYSDELLSYKADIWTVKPHLYWNMNPKGFKVYAGDSQIVPHIIKEGEDTSTFDEDRILYVPTELRSNYELDIDKALQETAGVALVSGGIFFPDDYIKKFFKLPQLCKEVDAVDFDDNTRIMDLDYVADVIDQLPDSRYLFVGLDAGYATDHYGIAIGYADSISYSEATEGNEGTKNFHIKIPFVMGLSRKKGQHTPLFKVRDFLYDIHQKRPIKMVAYDNFQTVELAQEMKLIGIDSKYISVEQDKYYILFKHGLCEGRVELPDNQTLYREFKCLKHTDNHIDHSDVETLNNGKMQRSGINSKDMADAVVRVYAAIRDHLELAVDIPTENYELQNEAWCKMMDKMNEMRSKRNAEIQNARYNHNLTAKHPFARRR